MYEIARATELQDSPVSRSNVRMLYPLIHLLQAGKIRYEIEETWHGPGWRHVWYPA